eukprot:906744_1
MHEHALSVCNIMKVSREIVFYLKSLVITDHYEIIHTIEYFASLVISMYQLQKNMDVFYFYIFYTSLIILIASINFGIVYQNYKSLYKPNQAHQKYEPKKLPKETDVVNETPPKSKQLKVECISKASELRTDIEGASKSPNDNPELPSNDEDEESLDKDALIKLNKQLKQEIDQLRYTLQYVEQKSMKTTRTLAVELNHLRDIIKVQNKSMRIRKPRIFYC